MPAPEGPTIASFLPGGMAKGEVVEDRAAFVVGEADMVEADFAALAVGECQGLGVGRFGDFGMEIGEVGQVLQVGEGLFQFAVEDA